MKKIILSAAVAAMAFSTSAVAADKGIDIVTTGQAVVYYQTGDNNGKADSELFDKEDSSANVGIQLNLDADLKNGFTFGSQLTYLGTDGLEKNLVSGIRQSADADATQAGNTTTELALTKIFVAKKIGNTTIKIGRQALPKSLSPLAYSEGWNVFKNTFDAVLVVNSDIPDTTLVGAYVAGGTGMTLGTTSDLSAVTNAGSATVAGTAYMLTAQNKSVPMTTITASYYDLAKVGGNLVAGDYIGATALWLDVAVADKSLPMGMKIGVQAGSIMPDDFNAVPMADTTAFGVKASVKPMEALTVCAAYTSVDGDDNKVNVAVKNTGTGVKTPLFTQMVANQDAIALDADTFMLKAAYNTGDYGTVILQGTSTTAGKSNLMNRRGLDTDYTDLELVYKVKAGGVDFLAAYVNRSWSEVDTVANDMDNANIVRLWARYNF